MDGNDPTTTIPAAAGGNSLVLVLILTLIAAALSSFAIRLFFRSLRPQASQARKTVAGALCAAVAFDLAVLVAITGGVALASLVALVGLAFAGYMVPAVRAAAHGMLHHDAGAPKQPPDRMSHV